MSVEIRGERGPEMTNIPKGKRVTTFSDVVTAWQSADVDAIHPLRAENPEAYWESGWFQAKQAAANITPGGWVLDFGCGDGRVAIPLAHMGFDVIAVDASEVMLRRLLENAAKEHNDFNQDALTTILSDGTELFGKIGRYLDAVVCRAVLIHHSHSDAADLVEQFASVLKPGGVLVCDWPVGKTHERVDWIDVTVWSPQHRLEHAKRCGLELVSDDGVSVWKRVN